MGPEPPFGTGRRIRNRAIWAVAWFTAAVPPAFVGLGIATGTDDPSNLAIEGWVNGERRHQSNTDQLIFPVPYLVEHVTRFMTLHPGDIITTGTPSGVGPLVPGDRNMVKIAGVGTLSNPCVAA